MGLSTQNVGAININDKRTKVLAFEKFHHELFTKERRNNPKFYPRIPYMYKGELVIGLFKREIGTVDIYIELCDSNFNPIDEQRTLWKWIFNPKYKDEYPLGDPNPVTGDQMYLIPMKELINVSRYHDIERPAPILPTNVKDISPKEEIESELKSVLNNEENLFNDTEVAGLDIPLEAITLRDLAAILWRKPVSSKPWFNELIKQTFK